MTLQPVLPVWILVAAAGVVLLAAVTARRRGGDMWLTAAALLLLAALLRPVVGGADPAVTRIAGERDPNVFVLVDRSPEMSEAMPQARQDVETLIERFPDARFAVIGFADRPSLDWPLSADTWSLRPVIDATDVYRDVPVELANAGAAGTVLRYQLIGAMQQFPRARNLVFYLGAGTPEAAAPIREFDLPEDAVDGGAVLGYGGEQTLRAVAEQIGVDHVMRDGAPIPDAVLAAASGEAGVPTTATGTSGHELYWVLCAGAAALLLIVFYRVLRDLRRDRLDRVQVGR